MWALGRLRSGQSMKAPDIASQFEVDVRTAYRDIDFLRDEWRVPLEFDRAKGSYVLTEPTAELPSVTISEGEVIALYFAEKVLAQYRGTPFEADLESAFRKIQDSLPAPLQISPSSLDEYLSFDPGPLRAPDAAIFKDVLTAHRLRRKLLVHYKSLSTNRLRQRRVHPYHVFNHRGDWYTAAWDELRRQVRIFALHRFTRATLTSDPYDIPKTFGFHKYMADAFAIQKGEKTARVAIRFAPRQARWIRERRWHPTARLQERRDGGLVLHLRIAETSEIRRWVLQFGPEAQVLTPKSLRREVAADLMRALAAYRSKSGKDKLSPKKASRTRHRAGPR